MYTYIVFAKNFDQMLNALRTVFIFSQPNYQKQVGFGKEYFLRIF